jgi:hypothetical protein
MWCSGSGAPTAHSPNTEEQPLGLSPRSLLCSFPHSSSADTFASFSSQSFWILFLLLSMALRAEGRPSTSPSPCSSSLSSPRPPPPSLLWLMSNSSPLCTLLRTSSRPSAGLTQWSRVWARVPTTPWVRPSLPLSASPFFAAFNGGSAYRPDTRSQYSPPGVGSSQQRQKTQRSQRSRRGLQSSDEEADDEQDGTVSLPALPPPPPARLAPLTSRRDRPPRELSSHRRLLSLDTESLCVFIAEEPSLTLIVNTSPQKRRVCTSRLTLAPT